MKTLSSPHGDPRPRTPETPESRSLLRRALLLVAVPALLLIFGCHPPGAHGLINMSQHSAANPHWRK